MIEHHFLNSPLPSQPRFFRVTPLILAWFLSLLNRLVFVQDGIGNFQVIYHAYGGQAFIRRIQAFKQLEDTCIQAASQNILGFSQLEDTCIQGASRIYLDLGSQKILAFRQLVEYTWIQAVRRYLHSGSQQNILGFRQLEDTCIQAVRGYSVIIFCSHVPFTNYRTLV